MTYSPGDGATFCCGVGSSKKAGGGGRFSKLPMEEDEVAVLAVFVIDAVLLIGGGGLLDWTDPRRRSVVRIVPVEYTAVTKVQKH